MSWSQEQGTEEMVAQWHFMATQDLVNIGSGNDILPGSTELLSEAMLIYNHMCFVVFTWEQFRNL